MPRTKSKTKSKPVPHSAHGSRASWKGQFSFGLVSFTVEAFNAVNRDHSDIHFNQIHAECHRRIRYQKVCPVHGVVENKEIVSGYEYKKDHYIELDPEDLQALRKESDKALKIEAFITPETIDPLYFDGRMYYLAPVGAGAHQPYSVIVGAMEKAGRCGVGSVIFSGKDQLVLVRPLDGILHMAMLNYEAEIRKPKSVVHVAAPKGMAREIAMAQSFIEEWSDDKFDFAKYEDPHRAEVKKLIAAKMKGKKIAMPKDEEEAPPVLNLMEALKKSLAAKHAVRKAGKHRAA